jgi:hypothetical protein
MNVTGKNIATAAVSNIGDEIKKLLEPPVQELSGIFGELDKILTKMKGMVAPFSQVQNAAIELAKSVGLAGSSIMTIATSTIEQNKKLQLSASYNMSSPEMIKMQASLMAGIGRNVGIDRVGTIQKNANGEVVNPNFDSELENLVAASKVFGVDKVAAITAGFDKLGKSMKAASKYTGKLFQEAGEYGINLDKYVENFTSNLEMAQMYNFRKGVDGLKEMARKATEIRQDMRQVAAFADKVGSVTGAVETASQLQVLGGSFASLANPLAMLNESMTNMEGLQDRLTKMTQGMAKYDRNTHQVRMNAYDRQRLKRAAEAMGVDPKNLMDQAFSQARRTEILDQMQGMGNLTDGFKKLVPNIGTINEETGAAGVTLANGEFKSLSDIAAMSTEEQMALQEQLIAENRSESEDIKVIAKSVMGIEDIISGQRKNLENEAARTNIMPGAIGGMSSYDMVLNFMTEKFTPSVADAAGKLELFKQSVSTFASTLGNSFLVGGLETVNANSPEEFGQAWRDLTTEMFGTSKEAKKLGDVIGGLAEAIGTGVKKINDYTKPYGFNLLPGHNTDAYSGTEGREEEPVARNPQADAATVLAAKEDVVTEATHRALNGGGADLLAPVLNPLGLLNNAITFTGTQNSLPWASVTPSGVAGQTGGQASQTGTGQAGQTGNYNFNISGNLTMTVNGDNGKIGTVDLTKSLMEDADFKRMLAYEIAKAMKEVDARGGIGQ